MWAKIAITQWARGISTPAVEDRWTKTDPRATATVAITQNNKHSTKSYKLIVAVGGWSVLITIINPSRLLLLSL